MILLVVYISFGENSNSIKPKPFLYLHETHFPNLSYFKPHPYAFVPSLSHLKVLTQEDFKQAFQNSSVQRAKYEGFMRNVEAALENAALGQSPLKE